MTKPAALGVALLALAACDAAGPTDPASEDPIVGTWSVASLASEEIATVSETQTVLDATSPGTSSVRVTGAESADLDVLSYVSRYHEGLSFSLLSYDPTGAYPARPMAFTVNDEPSYRTLQLYVQAEDYPTYYPDGELGSRMVRDGWTYRFQNLQLGAYDGRRVTVAGTFAFATRTLTADRPTVIASYAYTNDPTYRLDYTFGADGQFTIREGAGNASIERSGTWTRTGGRIELRRPIEDGTATQILEYAVTVDGTTLTLTNDRAQSNCTGGCLQSYEQSYGIRPGTLRRLDAAFSSRFVRAGTATASAQAATPQPPVPLAIRERLLLGPIR